MVQVKKAVYDKKGNPASEWSLNGRTDGENKEFVMTRAVTDEQFGHYSRRIQDMGIRVLKGSVPFQRTMDGLRALAEKDQRGFVDLVGPAYPKGTIALSLDMDISLSMEEMIRRGKYANEGEARENITEDRFPINRDVPEPRYSTTVLLIPPYREGITFKDQEAEMEANRLQQLGVAETLAIGARYPHLQYAYYIVGMGSSWRDSDGNRGSPGLWQGDGKRRLCLDWRYPGRQLHADVRCVALPQAGA